MKECGVGVGWVCVSHLNRINSDETILYLITVYNCVLNMYHLKLRNILFSIIKMCAKLHTFKYET